MKKIKLLILFFGLTLAASAQCPNVDASITAVSSHNFINGYEVYFYYDGTQPSCTNCTYTIIYGSGDATDNNSGVFPIDINQPIGSFTYSTPGTYSVSFSVDDGNGCADVFLLDVVIQRDKFPKPIFSNNVNFCLESNVQININTIASEQGGFILSNVAWNMGDSPQIINTTVPTINYQYTENGEYYVTAIVTYLDGSNEYITNAKFNNSQSIFTSFKVLSGAPDFLINQTIISSGINSVDFVYTGNPFPNQVSQPNPLWWKYNLTVDGVLIYSNNGNTFLSNGDLMATYQNLTSGSHEAKLSTFWKDTECPNSNKIIFTINDTPCDTCSSFKPEAGEYWMSAWVHVDKDQIKTFNSSGQENTFNSTTPYSEVYIEFEFLGTTQSAQFFPTGEIIDGWQRVVGKFTIPTGVTDFTVKLHADNAFDTYFDDIRIHPFNSSMKSYVYDGETFWLTSELDDNNYATFYEYDKEGGLIRIKKETSRGIVTIQETRSNTVKND